MLISKSRLQTKPLLFKILSFPFSTRSTGTCPNRTVAQVKLNHSLSTADNCDRLLCNEVDWSFEKRKSLKINFKNVFLFYCLDGDVNDTSVPFLRQLYPVWSPKPQSIYSAKERKGWSKVSFYTFFSIPFCYKCVYGKECKLWSGQFRVTGRQPLGLFLWDS